MGHNGLLNNQKGTYIYAYKHTHIRSFWIQSRVCVLVDLIPPEENIREFTDAEDRLEDSELM